MGGCHCYNPDRSSRKRSLSRAAFEGRDFATGEDGGKQMLFERETEYLLGP